MNDNKEIISLSIGENESAKYWLSVLNELKNLLWGHHQVYDGI